MPKNSKKNLMPKMGEIAIFGAKIHKFICIKNNNIFMPKIYLWLLLQS